VSALAHTIPRRPVATSLKQGRCMLAVAGECSGNLVNAVLVCRAHMECGRALRPFEAQRLCRYLRVSFGRGGD
jgi:hypothetical protein